jgi:hypothetical protein
VIVVFAGATDASARLLVERWTQHGASLMTPDDLSHAGWRCNSRRPADAQCVIGGRVHAARDVEGILVRSPTILEEELTRIIPSNRSYVAAEMNAFLVYWFSAFQRPVLNRPTPRSLGGPGWYPEHWIHSAASVGLRVSPLARSVTSTRVDAAGWRDHTGQFAEITLVGERVFGDADAGLIERARRLARASGVGLVSFRFDSADADAQFLLANPFPNLDDPEVSGAVLDCLTGASNQS